MINVKSNQDPSFTTAVIADDSCYTNSMDLLSANGRSQPKQFRGRLDEHRQNIKMLSGQDIEFELGGVSEHDKSRYFKSIIGNEVKVCLDCIKESSCPIEHSYIYSTHCLEHNTKLISSCSCGHEFSWDHELLNGVCSSCGENLIPSYDNVSEHQKFIDNASPEDRANIIWDLCCAASYILRPSDSTPELIHYDKLPNDINLFEQAYKLLTNLNSIKNWSHELLATRNKFSMPLGSRAVFAPIYELKKKLKYKWPFIEFVIPNKTDNPATYICSEFGVDYFAPRPRWKKHGLTDDNQNQLARDKASLTTISDVIGLEQSQTSEVLNDIELKPLNGFKKNGNLFYNLNELRERFSSVEYSASGVDFVYATTLDDNLPSFLAKRSNIFSWIYNNKVDGTLEFNDIPIYDRLKVSFFSVYKKMFQHLSKSGSQKISEDDALNVFNLTESDIKYLNRSGKLYPQKWQQSITAYYLVEDLNIINKQNFNYRRYCALRNLDFETNVEKLKKLDIEPLYGSSIYKCRYQVLFALRYSEFSKAKSKSEKPNPTPSNPLWFTLGIKPLR